MKDFLNKIHNADCLEFMKQMPDECVDCIVTSPPYWGLRAYGTNPQIWGDDRDCRHEWGNTEKNPKADYRYPGTKKRQGATASANSINWATGDCGKFCIYCQAWKGELGLEPTIELYISHLIEIFSECKRIIKKTGTCWINIGDTYSGTGSKGSHTDPKYSEGRNGQEIALNNKVDGVKSKSLCQIPERFSIAMTDSGWIKRNTIIWYKRNCMPSSAKDRFTVDFEYLYFFVKNQKYWFEPQYESLADSTLSDSRMDNGFTKNRPDRCFPGNNAQGSGMLRPNEKGRNKRCVWDITTEPFLDAHFAVYPRSLITTCIKAGCPPNGVVLDP